MNCLRSRLTLLICAAVVMAFGSVAWLASQPESAEAHPLGNFTVNRYSRIELYSDVVRVYYVLDMAEIPAFQEMDAIDGNGDGDVDGSENASYASKKADELLKNVRLTLNGEESDLKLLSQELSFPPGQGGLSTLRLRLVLETAVSDSSATIHYQDDNYPERLGWREIVLRTGEGVPLQESTAPTQDISDELRFYPDDLLSSPLDVTEATVAFTPGVGVSAPPVEASVTAGSRSSGNAFAPLIAIDDLTVSVLIISLLAALGFGALHALEPGHGKTFVAAYFVGTHGSLRQTMLLGLTVAATHTVGVLLIGVVTLYFSQFILPERLYPWLTLISGITLAGLGLRLLISRLGGLPLSFAAIGHKHPDDRGHEDDHDHAHEHTHRHRHRVDGRLEAAQFGAPVGWKSLIWLGLADGLTPSPSALIVLLAAVSLDRIALGIALILAFSVGLAIVLAMWSLVVVYARRLLEWWVVRRRRLSGAGAASQTPNGFGLERLLRLLPVGGALALVAMGLFLSIKALSQSGVLGV